MYFSLHPFFYHVSLYKSITQNGKNEKKKFSFFFIIYMYILKLYYFLFYTKSKSRLDEYNVSYEEGQKVKKKNQNLRRWILYCCKCKIYIRCLTQRYSRKQRKRCSIKSYTQLNVNNCPLFFFLLKEGLVMLESGFRVWFAM